MYIFIFLLGVIIGSFLNVCIYRIPKGKSIVLPRSYCVHCSTPLKWHDLIPIFSFLVLKGKCRYCEEKISPRYPFVEFMNGIMYLLLYFKFGKSIDFIYYGFLISLLIVIYFIDLDNKIILNGMVLILLIWDILFKLVKYFVYNYDLDIINNILSLFIASFLFILIYILSKGGIGGGDIKLIGVFGFILGFPRILLNVLLSFILGGIISIFLLIFKMKTRKDPIAFGPFLIIGFLVSSFWGYDIIYWYVFKFLR